MAGSLSSFCMKWQCQRSRPVNETREPCHSGSRVGPSDRSRLSAAWSTSRSDRCPCQVRREARAVPGAIVGRGHRPAVGSSPLGEEAAQRMPGRRASACLAQRAQVRREARRLDDAGVDAGHRRQPGESRHVVTASAGPSYAPSRPGSRGGGPRRSGDARARGCHVAPPRRAPAGPARTSRRRRSPRATRGQPPAATGEGPRAPPRPLRAAPPTAGRGGRGARAARRGTRRRRRTAVPTCRAGARRSGSITASGSTGPSAARLGQRRVIDNPQVTLEPDDLDAHAP